MINKILCKLFDHKMIPVQIDDYKYYLLKCSRCGHEEKRNIVGKTPYLRK